MRALIVSGLALRIVGIIAKPLEPLNGDTLDPFNPEPLDLLSYDLASSDLFDPNSVYLDGLNEGSQLSKFLPLTSITLRPYEIRNINRDSRYSHKSR